MGKKIRLEKQNFDTQISEVTGSLGDISEGAGAKRTEARLDILDQLNGEYTKAKDMSRQYKGELSLSLQQMKTAGNVIQETDKWLLQP